MIGKTALRISFLIMILAAIPAFGEEGAFAGKAVCVFTIMDLSEPRDTGDRQKTITDMIGLDMAQAGFTVITEEEWLPKAEEMSFTALDMVSIPDAVQVAKALDAVMAVSGYFILGEGYITVCIQCLQTETGALVAGFMKKNRFNLGFYNSLHAEITGMLEGMGNALDPAAAISKVMPKRLTELVFTSVQEGMQVLIGDVIVGFIEEGRLEFQTPPVLAGTTLQVEKRLKGHHTEREEVAAAAEIPLAPMIRENRYAVELDWTMGQLLGLGGAFRYYLMPDELYLSTSHYVHFQAPYTPGANGLLHYDAGVQVGGYVIWGPESEFRLGLSTGLGAVFSFYYTPGLGPAMDVYLNIVNVSAEWNLRGISLFFRPEFKYTLGIGPNLLGLDLMHWEVFPPMTLGVAFTW